MELLASRTGDDTFSASVIVHALVISAAGRHLATGDYKGRLSIWDLEEYELPVYSVKARHRCVFNLVGCVHELRTCAGA